MPTTSSKASHSGSPSKKPKTKLLVKFPCFKSKTVHADESKQETNDDDEETGLTIDDEYNEEDGVVSSPSNAIKSNMNALLELSLAAKLIEEQKQLLFKPETLTKAKRTRKN